MFRIRNFNHTDTDYQAIAEIENTVWSPDITTADELKLGDEKRDPQYFVQRVMVEWDGQVVAVGDYMDMYWMYREGRYFFGLNVHPNWRNRGIGTLFYQMLLQKMLDKGADEIFTYTREDQTAGIQFVEQLGFIQTLREPRSELDVQAFDASAYDGLLKKVEESGIKIYSIQELIDTDSDVFRKWYDVLIETDADVPSSDAPTAPQYDIWLNNVQSSPKYDFNNFYIAVDETLPDKPYVALTGATISDGDKRKLYTYLTGVVRSHRRQGIATAVKVRAIAHYRSQGYQIVSTENEERNPMYDINMKLGFQPQPAWLEYKKAL